MVRIARSSLPPIGVYHVTSRGVDKRPIFLDDHDRDRFLGLVGVASARHVWHVLAYCLMTNHIHYVIACRIEDLTRGMHVALGRYAQSFNFRYERTGHLFEARFHSRSVEDEEYLAYVCDYVFDNPIRAGLCRSREEWPWLGGALAS